MGQHAGRGAEGLIGRCIGTLEAEQRWVGWFVARRILPSGLSELLRIAFDVEDIVADLEGEADLRGIARDRPQEMAVRPGPAPAADPAGAAAPSGLPRVRGRHPVG